MIKYTIDNAIAVISWAMTSAPMNVLNDDSIPEFEAALQKAQADESVKGIIITSEKARICGRGRPENDPAQQRQRPG